MQSAVSGKYCCERFRRLTDPAANAPLHLNLTETRSMRHTGRITAACYAIAGPLIR
jgi:hypothetical protein